MQDFGLRDLAYAFGSIGCVVIIGMLWRFRDAIGAVAGGLYARVTVNDYQDDDPDMVRETAQTRQTDQTDRQTDQVSAADLWLDRLEVDRTRATVVELLVYSGWSVSDFRKANLLRGDNAIIGPEVEAARQRLGIVGASRQLRVRDDHGERMIPMDA